MRSFFFSSFFFVFVLFLDWLGGGGGGVGLAGGQEHTIGIEDFECKWWLFIHRNDVCNVFVMMPVGLASFLSILSG